MEKTSPLIIPSSSIGNVEDNNEVSEGGERESG